MNVMDKARARAAIQASENVMPLTMTLIEAAAKQGANLLELCQRQPENVDFRRNKMSFFGGRHGSVYSPFPQLCLPE